MTTTTIDISAYLPLPSGAVSTGEWSGEGADRGRDFEHAPVDIGDAILTIRGVQYANGVTDRSILMGLADEIPDDLTPLHARKLAAALQNFADTCEILDDMGH